MSYRGRSVRILVIEDDEEDFILLQDELRQVPEQNFDIAWAPSYDEGLRKIRQENFDICFLDYRLGRLTGLDLLKQFKEENIRVPTILLTGYGQREVDLEGMRLGAVDFLVKDQLNPVVLEKTVRYALLRGDFRSQLIMQDRMASVGLLASSLAHEIGTPLGVIRGRAEYVSESVRGNPVIDKNMGVIIAQIDRISKLIQSLLNVARGEQASHTGELKIKAAVDDVLELLAHEFVKNEIPIMNELTDEVVFKVDGNQEALHQVLLNLLVNAIHAIQSAKKKGRLQPHHVRIWVEQNAGSLSLNIEDTGCGISKANLNHLFKAFFTTKDIGEGTGLGLVTSYSIVESWKGTIQVESEEGVGTTFKVVLPVYGT